MLRVRVCRADADAVEERWVELPTGATAAQAAQASGLVSAEWQGTIGVHGEVVGGGRLLLPGDRVELYRPLPSDPRTRRRERARRRG